MKSFKLCKSWVAFVLALLMVFSFSAAAFADENPQPVEVGPIEEQPVPVVPFEPEEPIDPKTPTVYYYEPAIKDYVTVAAGLEQIPYLIEKSAAEGHGYKCVVDLKGKELLLNKEIYLDFGEYELTISNGTINGQNRTNLFYVCDADTKIILNDVVLKGGQNAVKGLNKTYGGAFYLNDDHIEIIGNNCTIEDCKARYGGAIYILDDAHDTTISGITFKGNEALEYGGAIYDDDHAMNVVNCTFNGNSAGEDGGAVYINAQDSKITNCTFTGNTTRNYGGSVYVNYSYGELFNCTFEGGSSNAGYGEDIYLNANETIRQCTFKDNSQQDAIRFSKQKYLVLEGCSFASGGAASLVSQGTLWVVIAIVVIAVAAAAVIFSKKKKNNTAA